LNNLRSIEILFSVVFAVLCDGDDVTWGRWRFTSPRWHSSERCGTPFREHSGHAL